MDNSSEKVLLEALSCGIIDLASVKIQVEKMRENAILERHRDSIWYSEKEDRYYCCLPDSTKKSGWHNVKRKNRSDVEETLVNFYMEHEELDVVQEQKSKTAMTVEELFWEFLEYKKSLVKPVTIVRMQADWKRFYEPHKEFTQKPYRKLTKIDIDKFFNGIVNKYDLKEKAFHNMCGVLKQMLEYAVDSEYIEVSPYRVNVSKKKIIHQRKTSGTGQIYTKEEKELILGEMSRRYRNNPNSTAPLAVMLDFELGARKGEILALAESDIMDGKIHICKQVVEKFDASDLKNIKSLGFEVVEYTKSEDGDRWLPLTQKALEIIEEVRRVNQRRGDGYRDFLFVRDGHILSPDALDAQIKRGCQYIGIPVKSMHKIRKTYGSYLYNNGVALSTVKNKLGHADESTTLKFYIYDTLSETEQDRVILNALEGTLGVD